MAKGGDRAGGRSVVVLGFRREKRKELLASTNRLPGFKASGVGQAHPIVFVAICPSPQRRWGEPFLFGEGLDCSVPSLEPLTTTTASQIHVFHRSGELCSTAKQLILLGRNTARQMYEYDAIDKQ